jgi:hypothetical protein
MEATIWRSAGLGPLVVELVEVVDVRHPVAHVVGHELVEVESLQPMATCGRSFSSGRRTPAGTGCGKPPEAPAAGPLLCGRPGGLLRCGDQQGFDGDPAGSAPTPGSAAAGDLRHGGRA